MAFGLTAVIVLAFSANGINDDYALFLSCTVGMFREYCVRVWSAGEALLALALGAGLLSSS
jgi:hypothetical protein